MLFHDAFDYHARSRGDACITRFEGRNQSYGEARKQSLAFAHAFLHQGIKRGDRIAVLRRNSADNLILILAASRVGAAIVPLNYRLAANEWIDLVRDAEAAMIVADPDFAAQFDARLAQTGEEITIRRICLEDDLQGWPPLVAASGVDEEALLPAPAGSDIIIQMYTSGTTGRAKGALLSHDAMMQNITQSSFAAPYRLNPGERTLVVLPLFHVAAISTAFCAIAAGACLVIHRDVDPAAIVRSLAEEDIVVASLVPAVIQFLLVGIPGIENIAFPALKYVGYGASPIAEPLLRKAMAVFKCHFAQGYGMTETAGCATMLSEADHERALRDRPDLLLSAGKPLPGTEIRIVGPDDTPLATGAVGEILVRGGQLMSGYWNLPEATDEALAGGWMHTGDAGYVDDEGYLFLRDRVKDMIVSGAENVYPVEIESVLFAHPGIADVTVIGVPDERWGEAVMAVIVCKPGHSLAHAELDSFCRQKLGGFKVPKRYDFVDTLPRNATGKVLKKDLRQRYWTGQERAIG